MATKTRDGVKSSSVMPRASRQMTLSFGLMNVAVAWAPLFKSTDDTPKGHKFCADHHGQVKQAWFCEHGNHYPATSELETAYECGGEHIVLGPAEVVNLEAERDGTVRLSSSCPVTDIDPSYFEKAYLLWPSPGKANEQAYRALLEAMRNTDLALLGQFVVSKTDRLLVIRWSPDHGALLAHVCNFGANLKEDDIGKVSAGIEAWAAPGDAVVAQAELLLTTLLGDFDPYAVENEYAARLSEALYAKAQGGGVTVPVEASQAPEQAVDLMESLRASIAAANAGRTA